MGPMRTRRLILWVAACALIFAVPYQCESEESRQYRAQLA